MYAQIEIYRPLPETSPQAMEAFCTDLARKIHDSAAIADRYGFADKDHVKTWLLEHPAVYRKVKELQAVWESSDNIVEKARILATHATIEAIPAITGIALNPDMAPGHRNDSFKEVAKVAGMGGYIRPSGDGQSVGGSDGRFSVQIVFQSEGRVESFTTREPPREPPPVIEGDVE